MEYKIQDIFNKFGNTYLEIYRPNYSQRSVFNKITKCRTNKLGVRIYKCNSCGSKIYTYNSCKDRHCPICLEYEKEVWIEKHKQDILDINYYHIVITIPHELKPIFYYNQKIMYKLLFKISSSVIINICKNKLNIDVGITSILHTWSQKGNYFPHIHLLLTGGGINKLGKWENIKDINELSKELIIKKFKTKLISSIKKQDLKYYGKYQYLSNPNKLSKYLDEIKDTKWNIYINSPFNSVIDIYEYFARYAFKVFISNERIKEITDRSVTFTYKDKNNRSITKETTIKGEEFIRKFLMHALPKSFTKIRYYGILSGKNKTKKMKKLRILTKQKKQQDIILSKIEILNKINGKDVTKCKKCHKGTYYLYKEVYPYKPPPKKNKEVILLNA